MARFEPLTEVAAQPSIAAGASARHQFLDLAGDGNLDVVQFERPVSGFFERTEDQRWESFMPFETVPNLAWSDPNLRFVDLTGDGHADILITEDDALTWYPSLAEEGFGTAIRIPKPRDEEVGPAVVFADGTQAIFLADLSGDGLDGHRSHPQRRGLLLAEPRLRPFRRQSDDGQRALVRQARPVRSEPYPPGRHRRLRNDRHYLSGAKPRRHLPERMRQRLESGRVPGELSGRG